MDGHSTGIGQEVKGAREARGRWVLALGFLGVAFCLFACEAEAGHLPGADFGAPVRTRDPAILRSLVVSLSTPEATRQEADRVWVAAAGAKDDGRLGALDTVVVQAYDSDAMRIYAMDRLVDADAGRAGGALMRFVPDGSGEALVHACAVAVHLKDVRLVEPLIESLDRVDGQVESLRARPEWGAAEALAGKPMAELLWDRIRADTGGRVAALDVLSHVELRHVIVDWLLAGVPEHAGDGWFADMRWWATTWGTIPRGRNECAWVQTLHLPESAATTLRAETLHVLLAAEGDYAAAPRFAGVLAATGADVAKLTREQLVAELRGRLDGLSHVRREPSSPGGPDDNVETLAANEGRLSRGDLLALRLLLDSLRDATTLAEIGRQAHLDLADTTSEHGGVLSMRGSPPVLHLAVLPAMFPAGDGEYIASDEAMRQAATGIALFHFHCQQADNSARAGPSAGDMAFARAMRATCVVITNVGKTAYDVDYYNPDGAVVDLGIYEAKE